MSASFPKSMCSNPDPMGCYWEVEPLGKWWGHEGRTLIAIPKELRYPFVLWGCSWKVPSLRKSVVREYIDCWHPVLRIPAARSAGSKFYCLEALSLWYFPKATLNGLGQPRKPRKCDVLLNCNECQSPGSVMRKEIGPRVECVSSLWFYGVFLQNDQAGEGVMCLWSG